MCSLLFSIVVFFNASMAMQPYRSYSIEKAISLREQSGWTLYIKNPTSLTLRFWIIPEKEVLRRTYNPAYLAWLPPDSEGEYLIRKSDRNKNPYLLRVLYYQDEAAQKFLFKEDRKINKLTDRMLLVMKIRARYNL